MQLTVKETKVLKTGTNKSGEWELIKVTSEDNTEYTTFDKKAKNLTGAVIDIEPIIKEGKLSFKDFKVIVEASKESSIPHGNGDQMSKGEWADKDRRHRESIEAQVAYKGIIELMVGKVASKEDETMALTWARARLGNNREPDKAEQDIEELWPADKTAIADPEPEPIRIDISTTKMGDGVDTEPSPEPLDGDTITLTPGGLDLEAFHEDMKEKGWTEEGTLNYLKNAFDLEADTTDEALNKLTKKQTEDFMTKVVAQARSSKKK